ncbi:unnamed protein product [Thelazia callipaeda]|uniref:DUF4129 domain-containing protein n=1 Tax=Thelazia callipaeda TaxID=103827 RepID=A0A0N5CZD2_THECL|nr:unnamed protein product [Thelazia callipaeda]
MIVDGYSVLFLFTGGLLIIIILAIFVQRQIFRMRDNSVRREANIIVGAGLSKRKKEELDRGIEIVRQFHLLRAPKFTEIGTIAEQRQLEFINGDLSRIAGESMYAYLYRIRQVALPSLSEHLCERVGSLAEHCRYRHQPFGEAELTETRALIKEIVRILNNEQERLSALNFKESTGSTLQGITKRLTAGENKKTKYKKIPVLNANLSAVKRLPIHKDQKRSKRSEGDQKKLLTADGANSSKSPNDSFDSRKTAADVYGAKTSECAPLIKNS